MPNAARTLLALAIAAIGAVPVAIGVGMLLSGPDRDGAAGMDWAPLAFPVIAFGVVILTLAWGVYRDGPTAAAGPSGRGRAVLALALCALGLAMVGLAARVFAHADGSSDTAAASIRIYALFIAVPGALLIAVAWRYRRPPRG